METLASLLGLAMVAWFVWAVWTTITGGKSRTKTTTRRRRRSNPAPPELPPRFDDVDYMLEWFEGDDGQGYILQRLRDRQRLSWQKLDPEDGLYAFYVRVHEDLGDGITDERFDPGSRLTLNEDERAGESVLSVWDEDGDVQLGWVSVGDHSRVREMVDGEDDPLFLVMWERMKNGSRKQVRALLATGGDLIGKLPPGERIPDGSFH